MATVRCDGHEVEAVVGRDLLGLMLDAGVPMRYICMAGSCGTCRVRVLSGGEHLLPMNRSEQLHQPTSTGEVRLACQAVVLGTGDVVITQE